MEWQSVVIQPYANKNQCLQIDEDHFLKFDLVKISASGVKHELEKSPAEVKPAKSTAGGEPAQSGKGGKKEKSSAEAVPAQPSKGLKKEKSSTEAEPAKSTAGGEPAQSGKGEKQEKSSAEAVPGLPAQPSKGEKKEKSSAEAEPGKPSKGGKKEKSSAEEAEPAHPSIGEKKEKSSAEAEPGKLSTGRENVSAEAEPAPACEGGKKEKSSSAQLSGGRVHIKCSEINQYWSTNTMADNRIAAKERKPVEDESSATCTLIEYSLNEDRTGRKIISFRIRSQNLWLPIVVKDGYLASGEESKDVPADFVVVDWTKWGPNKPC